MTMQCLTIMVSLLLVQGAALAQSATEPDANCPLKSGLQKVQLAGGRFTVMTVKNLGPQPCQGAGGCTNEVEVHSFTRAVGDVQACCTRIQYGQMDVKKQNPNVKLRWKLKSLDGKTYVFNPNSVYIIPPPQPTPDDLDPPKLNGNRTLATINSVNKKPVTFNYGVSVSLKQADGNYLACDFNDPVIVNQGN